jgi:very-short-patch-repair endonuclease
MVDKYGPVDVEIADLAVRQHGAVALRQLIALGLSRQAVAKRVAAGRLHPVYRGVYAVGHRRLTRNGRFMAAVLACGDGALLSHLSAAELYGFGGSGTTIDVTSATRSRSGIPGIRLHQPRKLAPEHRTTIDGIPVTTVPRLLADLAATLDHHGLKRVWQEAQRRQLLDVKAIRPLTSQPRKGISKLSALVEDHEDAPDTHTEFEHRFHDFITKRDIPTPAYNVALHGYVVDALYRHERLIIELDSRAYHWHRAEEDHDRDAELLTHGYRTYRITWRALTSSPDKVERRIRRMLGPLCRPATVREEVWDS